MGYKVIALDISDAQLETAKSVGADHVFNSMTDKDYVKKILEITEGGVDAAVNFTASKKAYDDAPAIIRLVSRMTWSNNQLTERRPGLGTLMVVGIPNQPLSFNAVCLRSHVTKQRRSRADETVNSWTWLWANSRSGDPTTAVCRDVSV